jgi:uncharacterized phiE125 gp8 family phage protein
MYTVSTDNVTLVTAPASEPVSVSTAKDHLRVDIADDDTLIGALITAAREFCEVYTGRSFVERTYRADLAGFVDNIWLPYAPIASITSVQYYNTDSPSTLTAWDAANYQLWNDRLIRADGASFPSVGANRPDAVQITYVAGWLDDASPRADATPGAVKQAILMMVGDMYENREEQVLYPGMLLQNPVVMRLLHSYRLYR